MRILTLALCLVACAQPQRPLPVATTHVVASSNGTVTVVGRVNDDEKVSLNDAEARVRIDGKLRTTRQSDCETGGEMLLDCDLGDGVRLSLSQEPTGRGITLRATVRADARHRVDGFEVLATPPGGLVLPSAPDELRYLHNGYQSWSFSGALDVTPGTVRKRRDEAIVYTAPNGSTAVDEHLGLSSHDAVLDVGDGSALVVGFTSVARWQGAVALEHPEDGRRLVAFNGFTGDAVHVDAGQPVSSEDLFVAYALTPADAMTRYGEVINERRDRSHDGQGFGQRGWFSWNRFFEAIDEATLFDQAERLKGLGDHDLTLIEIDDGWQKAWGDWTPNEKFRPVAELSAQMKANGQKLGLWAAPFVVEDTLPIIDEHPDWWVRNADGELLKHAPFGTPHSLRVVDTTHPDALAWVVQSLVTLQKDGAGFFKFDYLYAAALDGVRHDPEVTGVAALRIGLDAIFKALDTPNINLCGVPWLHAALSPASSIRTGADVAFGPPVSYGFVFVAQGVRNALARSFGPLAGRSDTDQFWLAPLSPAETRTALTWQLLLGQVFALGDDLSELDEAQRRLVQTALDAPMHERFVTPIDPFTDAGLKLFGSPILEAISGTNIVQSVLPASAKGSGAFVFTNWGEEPVEARVPACDGLSSPWGQATSGKVTLEPHDSLLYFGEGGDCE